MDRRTLLQALAATPLVWIFPGLRAEAKPKLPEVYSATWDPAFLELPKGLHIWESETDFVVAGCAEDAVRVFIETTGPYSQGFNHPCPWYPPHSDRHSSRPTTTEHEFITSRLPGSSTLICINCAAYINPPSEVPGLLAEHWKQWPEDKPFTLRDEWSDDDETPPGGAHVSETQPTVDDMLLGWQSHKVVYEDGRYVETMVALPRWWASQEAGPRLIASKDG
jgi:hypothetical protein